MTAVSTPDSLRTQPMSGSISPQAQDGAVTREITATNGLITTSTFMIIVVSYF